MALDIGDFSSQTLPTHPPVSYHPPAMPNPIVHFEIPADDPQRAIKFYEQALGWKISDP